MSLYNHFSDKQKAVLQARAERAARQFMTDKADDNLTTLAVSVRGESYALPIEAVVAVYENMRVVPIPCTPQYIAGIANIRGHILPVIDLGALLGAASQPRDAASLVVVASDDMSAAFCVEGIGAVQALSTTSLNPFPVNLDLTHTTYLKGTLSDDSVLLDVYAILNDPALVVNDAVN
jgi:purine-binding chemotaxis protein CheW